jgi:thiamine monophosphate kinase
MAEAVPVSKDTHIAAARLDLDAVRLAVEGGEDYELLLTCSTKSAVAVARAISTTGSSARVIGEIVEGDGVVLAMQNGSEESIGGSWEHF